MTEQTKAPAPFWRPEDMPEPADAVDTVEKTMGQLAASASVNAVFGQPVTNGASTVIPAAEVLTLAGFGLGYGGSQSPDPQVRAGGSGGGGGGRVLARPVAAIILSNGDVRVEPIVDVTKVALAMLTAAGVAATMLFRIRRGKVAA